LELATEHSPAFIAQSVNAIIAVVSRRRPADAAVLLGALGAHRVHVHQAGAPPEIAAERRFEAMLRDRLGDRFDALFAQGAALDSAEMIAYAFAQLDAVVAEPEPEPEPDRA